MHVHSQQLNSIGWVNKLAPPSHLGLSILHTFTIYVTSPQSWIYIQLQQQLKGQLQQLKSCLLTPYCDCKNKKLSIRIPLLTTKLLQHCNVCLQSFIITSGSEESQLCSKNILSAGLMTALHSNKVLQLQTCFKMTCIQHLPHATRLRTAVANSVLVQCGHRSQWHQLYYRANMHSKYNKRCMHKIHIVSFSVILRHISRAPS